MSELSWVAKARSMIGTAEKVGKAENPKSDGEVSTNEA